MAYTLVLIHHYYMYVYTNIVLYLYQYIYIYIYIYICLGKLSGYGIRNTGSRICHLTTLKSIAYVLTYYLEVILYNDVYKITDSY